MIYKALTNINISKLNIKNLTSKKYAKNMMKIQ